MRTLINTAITVPVLDNDSDPDRQELRVISVTVPANGRAALRNQEVTYTPNDGFVGNDRFDYTVSDGNCGRATATVYVTVYREEEENLNRNPEAQDDYGRTPVNTPVTVCVLDNDSDPDGDLLSVATVGAAVNGRAAVNGDNTVTYTPKTDFIGADQFDYSIEDGNGGTDRATVFITVYSPESGPHAVDDTASTPLNTPVNIPVLANDSGEQITVVSVTYGNSGITSINTDGTVKYTPNNGFAGSDSFSYTIKDNRDRTDTAKVTVTVNGGSNDPHEDHGDHGGHSGDGSHDSGGSNGGGSSGGGPGTANDPPNAVDDAATTGKGQPVTIPVLANDSDPNGDAITLQTATQGANGRTAVNADGKITYTPNAGFTGTDKFIYTISDEHGLTDTAQVTVTVKAGAQPTVDKVKVYPVRVPAGDPTITVTTGAGARKVYALLPDGRKLALKKIKPDKWQASFLVPFGTPDGPYRIKVFVADDRGLVRRSNYSITIDNSLPLLKIKQAPQADGSYRLEVKPLFNARSMSYTLTGERQQPVRFQHGGATWTAVVRGGDGTITAVDESGYEVRQKMSLPAAAAVKKETPAVKKQPAAVRNNVNQTEPDINKYQTLIVASIIVILVLIIKFRQMSRYN